MSSGVKLDDEVKILYTKMKVVKSDDEQSERIRIATFHIDGDYIKVAKVFREKDLCGNADCFKLLLSQMEVKKPCYVLYDCHFETTESSKKEELVFILWCSDDTPVRQRMHYASSKQAFKELIKGLKHDLEIHDLADCCTRGGFADKLGKKILTLEGISVCPGEHGKHGEHEEHEEH